MRCLDFRRQLLQDPCSGGGDFLQHEESCQSCAAYARDVRAKEAHLRAVLNHVPVPAELPDKIRLGVGLKKRRQNQVLLAWAMAASVLVVLGGILIAQFNPLFTRGSEQIAQHVLQHVAEEWHHYDASKQIPSNRLHLLFKRFNAKPVQGFGQVTFAAICPMLTHKGVHLALNGEVGPITVFYMPGEYIDHPILVSSNQLQGQITPAPWGSLAVVGEHDEALGDVMQQMQTAVLWPENVTQTTLDKPSSLYLSQIKLRLLGCVDLCGWRGGTAQLY